MGWLTSQGKTPEFTMNARIISEIKREQKSGKQPRFTQLGKGFVSLRKYTDLENDLASQIEQHKNQVQESIRQLLQDMDPIQFETLISDLLSAMGFVDVEVTQSSNDHGIDVRGTLVWGYAVHIKMAVQVKRWQHNVQSTVVQQVRGSLSAHEQGLIVTTSGFGKGAINEALDPKKTPIALMNGKQLALLLMENEMGVTRSPFNIFEIDEEFFRK